jgi:hypothetical protein
MPAQFNAQKNARFKARAQFNTCEKLVSVIER